MTMALDPELTGWFYTPVESLHHALEGQAQKAITTELGRILARQQAVALAAQCDAALPAIEKRIAELEATLPALQTAIDAAQVTVAKAAKDRKAAAGTRQEDLAEHAEHLARRDLDAAQVARKIADNELANTREKLCAVQGLRDKFAALPEPDLSLLRGVLAAIAPTKGR
jgi:hypothetical protein